MIVQEQAGTNDFWSQRQTELEAKLDAALVAQRDAFDGGRRKLTYLEGHACIAQLNRIFGYGTWSYTLDQMGVDECTEGPQEDWYAQFFAVVTLRVGGASRQDLGTAEIRNTRRTDQRSGVVSVRNNVRNVDSRATARKGAVTDALKRAARTFGQQFGNGLYDQDDNIYAWMAAHSLCAEEGEGAGATSESTAPGAEPAAKDKDKDASASGSRPGTATEAAAHAGGHQQGAPAVVRTGAGGLSLAPGVAPAAPPAQEHEQRPSGPDGKPLGARARALLGEIGAAESYSVLNGAQGIAARVRTQQRSGDLTAAECAALFDAINKKNQALRAVPHAG